MTKWRGDTGSSNLKVRTVLAIMATPQYDGFIIPDFQIGEEIQLEGPTGYLGTGKIVIVIAEGVQFTVNEQQFMMTKNTPDDLPSRITGPFLMEDWTIREVSQ